MIAYWWRRATAIDLPGTVGHLVWPLQLYGHSAEDWWAEQCDEVPELPECLLPETVHAI